jgi:ABC-type nickel/cobalt efflux system permease component RcnA
VASSAFLLFLSSCTTAVIHALIPDHWLPFALMARTEGWTGKRTLGLVALTGLLHVAVSLLVGVLFVLAGDQARGLADRVGARLESLGGALLILFGLAYGLWAHRRERRAHASSAAPAGGGDPDHEHDHGTGGADARLHAHGHLLSGLSRGRVSGRMLVAIIGISPCVLLQPILFAAAAEGGGAVAAAIAGFSICTVLTMLVVTWIAGRGLDRLRLGFFTRYGDLLSGLVIAGLGLLILFEKR